ncbi:hypothetical protein [Kitasatospora sp. NPDC091207]|uniref:hypothetical protein n=1 Tax=Kitasatospora sp. NPDC091207 TaxID=3364083 RepID=UPI0038230239
MPPDAYGPAQEHRTITSTAAWWRGGGPISSDFRHTVHGLSARPAQGLLELVQKLE